MFDHSRLNQTLPEKVAHTIGERITSGVYEPGERLVEAVLAKELKVSHGPIRDALRLLQYAGVVTIEAYRGAIVTEYSEREIQELYQVRSALVGLRARWLAEDPDRESALALVADTIGRMPDLAKSPRTKDAYISAALAVSQTLSEHISNRWLRTTLQALTLQTKRYTRMSLDSADRRRQSAKSWGDLLDAMRRGDGERAQQLASAQSLMTRDAALKLMAQSGQSAVKKKKAADSQ